MSGEFTPAEVAASCPLLLAQDEMAMQRRVDQELADLKRSDLTMKDLVGVFVTHQGIQLIASPNAELSSRRDFDYDKAGSARVVRPTRVCYFSTTEPYEVLTPDVDLEDTPVGFLLSRNVIPITAPGTDSPFSVFQTFPPAFPYMTRSGFLAMDRAGLPAPVIVTRGEKRYAVEVKGCGSAQGYFARAQDRMFQVVAMGGLPLEDTEKEVRNLQAAHKAGQTNILPLAHAELDLDPEFLERAGRLGIVFRLTPSTLRLSHGDIPGSLIPESKTDALVVVDKLVTNFVSKFFQAEDNPIFISPASHLENYLVEDGLRISETDFEDFRSFGSGELPFVHSQTGQFVDARTVVEHYFTNFGRVEQFDPDSDHRSVAAGIEKTLANLGVSVDLAECDSITDIGTELWDQWLVNEEQKQRVEQGYQPGDIARFLRRNAKQLQDLLTQASQGDTELLINMSAALTVAEREEHSHLLRYLTGFGLLYHDRAFVNAQRYPALMNAKSLVDDSFKKIDLKSLPPSIQAAYKPVLRQYEIAARTCSTVHFFKEWVSSELNNFSMLSLEGDRERYRPLVVLLLRTERALGAVLESSDIGEVEDFIAFRMENYLQAIEFMCSSVYGK